MINSKLLLLGERTLYAFTESKMRIGVCKCAFLPLFNAFDRRFQQTFEWMGTVEFKLDVRTPIVFQLAEFSQEF